MSKVIEFNSLTPQQQMYLEEIPEWMHGTLVAVWQDYKNRKTWNTPMERSKSEHAFYLGVSTCLAMSTPKSPGFLEETPITLPSV